MPLPDSDEPASISQDEARQELFGRGPSKVGMEVYEVVAIVLGIVGAGIAVETIDSWAQWVVLAGDRRHGDRLHDRREPQSQRSNAAL